MLTRMKSEDTFSTAGEGAGKRGKKGRFELNSYRKSEDVFGLEFVEYGNFGPVRWRANFGNLDRSDLEDMIVALNSLLDGDVDSTALPEEVLNAILSPPEPESVVTAEPVEEESQDVMEQLSV